MTIRAKQDRKPSIDLDGPDGNAFHLLGTAGKLAKDLGLDADAIRSEMMAGDYEHLLQVFDSYFGEFIDLERSTGHE